MSIFDSRNEISGAVSRPFVDRYGECRDFARRINVDPPPQEVLFYAGVGGNGKTVLLRTLKDKLAYRLPLDQWLEIDGYPDDHFVASVATAPGAQRIPVAQLDFGAQPQGANRPMEPLGALFMLKRQLAEHQIATPRFDFAAISYLQRSGADARSLIKELFPSTEVQNAGRLLDGLVNLPLIPVGAVLFEWMNRRLDAMIAQRRLVRRAPRDVVEHVLALTPEPDLMDALPRFFADDLRAAMASAKRPSRIVLLFDTYEAVAGEGATGGFSRHGGPRWFRSLLGHLPLADGVLVVVAGRAAPLWSSALVDPIPDRFVRLDTVGPLPELFARRYIGEAGLSDPELAAALVAYAQAEPGAVHPLLLGLAMDVAFAGTESVGRLRPEEFTASAELRVKERELVARLLQRLGPDLQEAVAAVAAARAFDRRIFDALGARFGYEATTANFHHLISLSFVTPHPDGARYAVHQLLRRAISAVIPAVVSAAHESLADYYESVSLDERFHDRLERIYHRAALNPAEGVALWLAEMDAALSISRFDRCRALLALLGDLDVPTPDAAEACTSRVVRADIAFGEWSAAEERLQTLPESAAGTLLLWANLAFVRGDFALAKTYSDRALATAPTGTARLPFLLMAAELALFLGQFDAGRDQCLEGLAVAAAATDPNETIRWRIKLASIEFFAGRIEQAKAGLAEARRRLEVLPEAERDQNAEAGLCVEEAVVAEAEGRAADAGAGQAAALRIRREIGDLRGEAHALNGLGLAALQLGDGAAADARFVESAAIARDLGEELLFAKTMRGRAEAAILIQRFDDADRFAAEALAGFERAAIPYDVTHATITSARIRRARGDEHGWLEQVDRCRREIETEGFGSLYARCPEAAVPGPDRVSAALTAFAAGDALGVPWEGSPPDRIDPAAIPTVPATPWGWPRGATSDDTAQVLIVAGCLLDSAGEPDARRFIARLAEVADEIRGLGPTTGQALERFRETGELPEPQGTGARATNGAAMRILPVGWATPAADPELRRRRVRVLGGATHRAPAALAVASVVAALGSWAMEGVAIRTLMEIATAEIAWAAGEHTDLPAARSALEGTWTPPTAGVSLDADETMAAVIHVLSRSEDLASALQAAVVLGGDTDTVAAMVGGILGARSPEQVGDLEWLGLVDFTPRPDLADGLYRLRRGWYSQ